LNTENLEYDFSCWVIKYEGKSICGKIYQKDSLKNSDGVTVPLLWNHQHNELESVLGYAILESRDEGIYAYCTLYNIPAAGIAKDMITDRGSVSLSPYIKHVKFEGKYIVNGTIAEVSLVLARIDPDEAYYPIMRKDDD
jgi:hypothetical protein